MKILYIFLIVLVGLFAYLGYFNNLATLIYTGNVGLPAHIYSGGNYYYSCNSQPTYAYSSNYIGVFGDYQTKYNVDILYVPESFESYSISKAFTLQVPIKTYYVGGFSPVVVDINEGIPAQVKCDGSKDCNFGFTTEKWELQSDGNCYLSKTFNVMPDEEQESQINNPVQSTTFFQRLIILIKYYWEQLWN